MGVQTKLVELYAGDPKGHTLRYEGIFGPGLKGWLVGLTNKTLGPIYFQLLGAAPIDITNPSTFLEVDSMRSLTVDNLKAVFGSPAPQLPVDIAFTIFYPGFKGDSGTDSSMDVHFASGPTLPLLELEVQYLLASPVSFFVDVQTKDVGGPGLQFDSCGNVFRITGSTVTLTASVEDLQAQGMLASTKFTWKVSGATVTGGSLDSSTITLLLDQSRSVQIEVVVDVVTQQGSGAQIETETTTQSSSFSMMVLSPADAALSNAVCKILQATLPIRRFVFPGDPAAERAIPGNIAAVGDRLAAATHGLTQALHSVVAERTQALRSTHTSER
jgi:hypothetical protein